MSGFNWRETDPWEVSTAQILPKGTHLVRIESVEDGRTSNGNPQIILQLANAEGEIRDWMVITEASFGKVISLANAANVQPDEEEIAYFQEHNGEAPASWQRRLEGVQVGVVVRTEPSYKDPSKMRNVVAGYVSTERVTSNTKVDQDFDRMVAPAAQAGPDDIPF